MTRTTLVCSLPAGCADPAPTWGEGIGDEMCLANLYVFEL